jgi:hypothetical protein
MQHFLKHARPAATALALALATGAALADSTSSAASSTSASLGSSSTSLGKSSDGSSSSKDKVAQGPYTLVEMVALADQPDRVQLRLAPVAWRARNTGAPAPTGFTLTLPRETAERARLAVGQVITAEHRPVRAGLCHGRCHRSRRRPSIWCWTTPGTANWPAARSVPELRIVGMRSALALGLALIARASLGASLDFCHGPSEPGAAAQDRLIQVAAVVKAELDQSGAPMALVSRSGLALQRLDQRYSHAGVSLKASDNAPWSVRQLYYACDEQRPRLFDQGMSGFVMGANDPDEGYLSIVLLPAAAAAPIERAARDDAQALKLLGDTYSANAYAFSTRYQNCNQWLAELMASAWAPAADAGENRARAQQALMRGRLRAHRAGRGLAAAGVAGRADPLAAHRRPPRR